MLMKIQVDEKLGQLKVGAMKSWVNEKLVDKDLCQ
jgi:hypothetical protein